VALASAFLGGCGQELKIPQPNTGTAKPLPPIEPSVIEIAITMNLAPMFAEVEKAVPKRRREADAYSVVAKNTVGDVGIKYEVWRDPLRLDVQGNRLRAESKVYYWFQFAQRVPKPFVGGAFWQDLGSCGTGSEQPRQAVAGLETTINWTPEWGLASSTSVLPTNYLNKCRVTFLNIDITNRVDEAFGTGLKQGATLADTKIRQLGNFRPIGERIWKELLQPIALGNDIWLTAEPQAAYVAPLKGNGQTVSTVIGLTATPKVIYGAKPTFASRPLPKLAVKDAGGGLRVAIEGDLTFDDASRQLAKALVGEKFTIAGHRITIAGASVYGAGDIAVMPLMLKGDIEGMIYLIGKPAYDSKKNILYVRDLDFSLETGHALANVADWLNHGGFRNSIAARAQWPLSDQIVSTKERIEKALNRTIANDVIMRASISAIRPAGVYITPTSFRARAVVEGSVRVEAK
jgi:hypothetical protein